MSQKQGSTKSTRDHKESKGLAKGAKKTHLSPLQKVLMNGGLAHHLRKGKSRVAADETKSGRLLIAQANEAKARGEVESKKKKSRIEGSGLAHRGKAKP